MRPSRDCPAASGTFRAWAMVGSDQCRIANRRQGHNDRPTGRRVAHGLDHAQRQPGLADAAGTGQRQQAHVGAAQERDHGRQLLRPGR